MRTFIKIIKIIIATILPLLFLSIGTWMVRMDWEPTGVTLSCIASLLISEGFLLYNLIMKYE